ncbi:hypothetical protein ACTAQI_07515 [Pseudarthrobacter sp. alpha12b]
MSTVSEQVAAHIGTDNPTFLMKGFPASTPDNIPTGKVAVHVYRTGLRKASANVITHSLIIRVMVPGTNPEAAEVLLENALEAVLKRVETFAGLRWSEGERFSLEDKFHAYDITAEADAVNAYRPSHQTS